MRRNGDVGPASPDSVSRALRSSAGGPRSHGSRADLQHRVAALRFANTTSTLPKSHLRTRTNGEPARGALVTAIWGSWSCSRTAASTAKCSTGRSAESVVGRSRGGTGQRFGVGRGCRLPAGEAANPWTCRAARPARGDDSLEELVRRPRSLVSRRSRARYFRSEDGHPSPSPDQKRTAYGPERAHMIRRTFQV
jgi:hypothetical protein